MPSFLLIDNEIVPKRAAVNFGGAVNEEKQNCLEIMLHGSEVLAVVIITLAFCDAHFMQVKLLVNICYLLTKVCHLLLDLENFVLKFNRIGVNDAVVITQLLFNIIDLGEGRRFLLILNLN